MSENIAAHADRPSRPEKGWKKNKVTAHASGEDAYRGIGTSRGIAIGAAYAFEKEQYEHENKVIAPDEAEQEIERFLEALRRSEKELKKIERVTTRKLGKGYANLFEAQIMLLHDPVLIESITNRIRTELKAASLVIDEEFGKYLEQFMNSDDQFFQERACDFRDIKERIIRNLHIKKLHSWIPEGSIVVSEHLSPADVILLSRSNVKGFVTDTGGKTSHIALICKSLNIPMVVGLGNFSQLVSTGDLLIIDGESGTVVINPDQKTIEYYTGKRDEALRFDADASLTAEQPAYTRCGVRISFFSNIDFKEELLGIRATGSEGVGLFRTENLFIDGTKVPSESEQLNYYLEMAETLAPMPLVVRLFDIGGDKLLYSPVREPNPNLGWRGIRILIDVPEILESQLRAVLQANVHGNIHILLPMISSIEEIRFIKETLDKLCSAIREEKGHAEKPFIGAMIEVPAAVEMIAEISREVDFVSIGTNDLTQYTLAVDRNNVIVQDLFDKFHPAIVRQVHRVITTAQKNRCRVSICGDMGSDRLALPFLLGCGLRKFSVVCADIAKLKKLVSGITLAETEIVANECLQLDSAAKIKGRLEEYLAAL
ncbi:MAG: phosphoenolpyruvate--protein phosphotransferase [Chlorobiaceae bacterium]|nr:phosphoenolpyruvate--protein phosphotransferase [Chlorobiaceae bacterium]